MQTETLTEFLKGNPNSNKAQIGEAMSLKGLPLFNLLKKLQKDGVITIQGEGQDATYSLSEGKDEQVVSEDQLQVGEVPQSENIVPDDKNEEEEEEKVKEQEQHAVVETKAIKTSGRDNKKYKFNGQEYGKGQLVRAVVAHYCSEMDPSYKELKSVFPDDLVKRFGIFQDEVTARKLSGSIDRYFLKNDQIIKLKDKKIAVCNQFTSSNIVPFLQVCKTLGLKIK